MAAWIGRVSGLVSNLKRGAQVALAAVVILAFVGVLVALKIGTTHADPPHPTIHFSQLPWQLNTSWRFQTGPHNDVSGNAPDGLDFYATGSDLSVRAVSDGLIVKTQTNWSGTPCGTKSCASDVLFVQEKVSTPTGSFIVSYYHLASVSVAVGQQVKANQELGVEGGTGYSVPAGYPHLFISVTYTDYTPVYLDGGTVSFGQWTVTGSALKCTDSLVDRATQVFSANDYYQQAYGCVRPGPQGSHMVDNYASQSAPTRFTPTQTNEAGHVMVAIGQAGVLDANLKPLVARCTSASSTALIYQGDHVVVIDNTAIKNVDTGEEFYKVVYPDPCEPGRDFSPNANIYVPMSGIPPNAAVGYVSNSVLQEVNSTRAVNNGAVWRDCWGPDRCGDAHQVAGTVLASADSPYLYAWWTGQYWDPHWFHVKDAHGHDAAVYGRDWTAAYTSAPIVGSTSTPVSCSKSALFSACATPTSASQPPVSQPPTPQPPAPSPTAMTYTPTWHSALNEFAPSCNLLSGELWYNPLPSGTYTNCASSGFIQQQTSQYLYAETDLKYFDNQTYDQSNFRTSVQATFLNPGDAATYATLIVQTPQAANAAGGYIFGVNSAGQWRLQYVQSGSSIPTVASGQVGGSSTPTIAVQVRGGQLAAWVNGQQVGVWPDGLGGADEMGIMTQKDGQPSSSQVQYNHFTLDFWY